MNQKYVPFIVLTILILIIFGVPIWDKTMPMVGGEEVIHQEFGNQFAWCVAFTYASNSSETNRERIYLLFPKVFSDGSLVSVSSTNEDSPSVSQRDYGALFIAFVYGSMYFSCWKLMRKRANKINSQNENAEDLKM